MLFSWGFLISLGLNVILISLLWLGRWDRCFPLGLYGSAVCFTGLPGCKDPAELFKFSFTQLKRACPLPQDSTGKYFGVLCHTCVIPATTHVSEFTE